MAEQFVFVTAEPGLPFSKVAEVIDIATVHEHHVALLPPISAPYQFGDACPEMAFKEWQVEPLRSDRNSPIWH
jgi:hypothetical protein